VFRTSIVNFICVSYLMDFLCGARGSVVLKAVRYKPEERQDEANF
jgi:hypothetical protein